MAVLMEHERQCQKIQTLAPEALALWKQLERYTVRPLHRLKASELFLEVLALQDSGTEVDWPSVFCAITTLTRLDRECLQARLAVGCSKFQYMQFCYMEGHDTEQQLIARGSSEAVMGSAFVQVNWSSAGCCMTGICTLCTRCLSDSSAALHAWLPNRALVGITKQHGSAAAASQTQRLVLMCRMVSM